MRLYLTRHGEASEDRLTESGRAESESVAALLASQKVPVDAIYHSAKLRAKETADIFSKHLCPHHPPKQREGLKPMDPIAPLLEDLVNWTGEIMIVGHLPFLSTLLSSLLDLGDREGFIDLCAASVCCLEGSKGAWKLVWFITPKLALCQVNFD